MNSRFQLWVTNQWQGLNLFSVLLAPISFIFCLLVSFRRFLYQHNFLKQYKTKTPIIVIGNISVGGTGKTPLLLYLVQQLKEKNFKVGIISRGYKAQSKAVQAGQSLVIDDSMSAMEVGDEPYLIYHRGCVPVVIGRTKSESVDLLLKHFQCDVILSDDGLQHYALARDVEICVFDIKQQFGNQLCLPAGPLRERVSRLKTVDYVIANQASVHVEQKQFYKHLDTKHDIFPMSLSIGTAYPLSTFAKNAEMLNLNKFSGQKVHAIAGIGQPKRFFSQLSNIGLDVIEHPFSDHYSYNIGDLDFNDHLPVFMTEKDAVKCINLFNESQDNQLLERLWVVPLEVTLSDTLISFLTQKLGL